MRVLVVEDEPDLRSALQRLLREAGYAVDTAQDGEDGLFKALGVEYDAIVLDLMLPKLDGWSLLRRLRDERSTPVLVLTARDAVADRVRGLDHGADDYLAKPFASAELLARLRALTRRAAGADRSALDCGDLEIDLAAKVAKLRGTAVALTPREYALLEFLALHRGAVVSRTTLYEHLYDENDDSLSNLLDVHVSNLRKKLGAERIVTRRGQGYVLDV